jgi:hypothetical protein
LLEQWKAFIEEHNSAPTERGSGHALARCTRQKLAAGHLSVSEITELNRLKGEASRASNTNHPAVVSGVGTQPGVGSRCHSSVEQSGGVHPADISHDTPLDDDLQRQVPEDRGGAKPADISHDSPVLPTISLDDDLLRQVLQLGRMPIEVKNPQTDSEIAERKLKKHLYKRGLLEHAQHELNQADLSHDTSLHDELLRQVLQLGRVPTELKNAETVAELQREG